MDGILLPATQLARKPKNRFRAAFLFLASLLEKSGIIPDSR
jgi:hypothetical protein